MIGSKKSRNRGIVLILLAALLLGSYGVWSRFLGNSFDAFSQGWIRAVIVSVILLPIVFYKKQLKFFSKKDLKWFAVFLITPSFTQAPIFYAYNHMDIGTATLLLFVSLLITMYCVGFLILKEKISRDKILSLVLAVIGLLFIFSFSLEKFTFFAASMAILVGVASGLQVSFSKKLSGNYSSLYLCVLGWVAVIPSHIIGSFWLGRLDLPSLSDPAWIILFFYALAGLFSFWFYLIGLKYIEASIGGLIGLMEIIFGILFGMLFFGEVLTPRITFGALLVIIAAAMPNIIDLINQRRK